MKTVFGRFRSWLYRWTWALRYLLFKQLPPRVLFPRWITFRRLPAGHLALDVFDVLRGGFQFVVVMDATGWPNLIERLEKMPASVTIDYRGVTATEMRAAYQAGDKAPEWHKDIVTAVWIVCGGAMQVAAVEAAHRLQLRAIVSDRDPNCACAALADEFVPVDIYDVPGHIAAAEALRKKYNIVGVFTEGADVEVTVAELAHHLKLPGIDPAAAERCKDKVAMRWAFEQFGLERMKYNVAVNQETACMQAEQIGYPLMVKAVDNCGSRGTHRVEKPDQVGPAVADAIANSTTGTVLLEEFLEGPQQSVEILFDRDGAAHWLNIVDRLFDGVMELGHVNPTRLKAIDRAALFELAEKAARAVGVSFGAFKCDTIWTQDGPRMIECTARLSGGWDCQLSTPRATGRDFITAAMRVALGLQLEPDELQAQRRDYCAVWAAFPTPGRVVSIGNEWAGMPDGVTDVRLRVGLGDVIVPYTHCATRPAFVAAVADSYDEAVSRAKVGAAALAERIVTE